MWRDAYLDGQVLSADPIELVHILYEHTLSMVRDARRHLAAGDIHARSHAVSRAIAAIDELYGSLDRRAGGSISRNLASLYQYMRLRLLAANSRQEDAPLAEVESLLSTLGEAWSAIRPGGQTEESKPADGRNFAEIASSPEAEVAVKGWSA